MVYTAYVSLLVSSHIYGPFGPGKFTFIILLYLPPTFKIILFILKCFVLAMLGLLGCVGFPLVVASRGYSLFALLGL